MRSEEWYTPKYILDALGITFDMDVASPEDRTHCHVSAKEYITELSLMREWKGTVWMNPPYGKMDNKFEWINKFIQHANGIALMPDRSSAPWHQYFTQHAEITMNLRKKVKFIRPDGSLGESPSNGTTLFAIGEAGRNALINAEITDQLGICQQKVISKSIFIFQSQHTWRMIIHEVVEDLGGTASLSEMYTEVVVQFPGKLQNNNNYKAKVRQVAMRHLVKTAPGVYSIKSSNNN